MLFQRLRHAATLCFVAAFVAVPAAAKTISVKAGTPDANEKLQEALILAEPGDTVELGAGVWKLTDGLSLDVDVAQGRVDARGLVRTLVAQRQPLTVPGKQSLFQRIITRIRVVPKTALPGTTILPVISESVVAPASKAFSFASPKSPSWLKST